MATSTSVYQLRKPGGSDYIDEGTDINDNMDKIEAGLLAGRVPVGTIVAFAGTTVPSDKWEFCEGAALDRTLYATLYTLIGTTYGVGDGSTTFNLPNLKGKVPVGLDSGQTEFDAMAETGGAKTHTLTTAEMPVHDHVLAGCVINWGASGNVHFNVGASGVTAVGGSSTGNNQYTFQGTDGWSDTYNAGSGNAHNNLQPYIVIKYLIKVKD